MEPIWKHCDGVATPPVAAEAEPLGAAAPSLSGARKLMSELRAAAGGAAADWPAVVTVIERLQDSLSLIFREHEGMANDLLRVYEQMGIIFEVTRRLSEVRSESEVVLLFVDSLRRTYRGVHFGVVSGEDLAKRNVANAEFDYQDWIWAAATRAQTERSVIVESRPTGASGTAWQALVGPVLAGQTFVAALVMVNDSDHACFDSADMLLLDALTTFCGDLIRNFRLMGELRQLSVDMVRALVGAVDQKDTYTSGHSNRVRCYARLLGEDLGLNEDALQMLEWSALLHDVGKIGIRDEVLKKAGRLTEEEFAHIKEHPVRSYEVVRGIPQLAAALDGILHHHEHYDGKGYPRGLVGEAIPLQARIIQIADVFDALTTSRSYRHAFAWEQALEIIKREAGTTVDPQLAPRFDQLIRRRIGADPQALMKLCAPWWPYEPTALEGPSA